MKLYQIILAVLKENSDRHMEVDEIFRAQDKSSSRSSVLSQLAALARQGWVSRSSSNRNRWTGPVSYRITKKGLEAMEKGLRIEWNSPSIHPNRKGASRRVLDFFNRPGTPFLPVSLLVQDQPPEEQARLIARARNLACRGLLTPHPDNLSLRGRHKETDGTPAARYRLSLLGRGALQRYRESDERVRQRASKSLSAN